MGKGYRLASTMHCDTTEEVIDELRDDIGVDPSLIGHLTLVLRIEVKWVGGQVRRRGLNWFLSPAKEGPEVAVLTRWDESSERFTDVDGVAFKAFGKWLGEDPEAAEDELQKRAELISGPSGGTRGRRADRSHDRKLPGGGQPLSAIVLWDIDEALIRTGGAGSDAMTTAFAEIYGVENGFARVSSAAALTTRSSLTRWTSTRSPLTTSKGNSSASAAATWRSSLSSAGRSGYVLPGVLEVIDGLERRGAVQGVGPGD